jgi:type II secretory pathway predicted ATPase ExeA
MINGSGLVVLYGEAGAGKSRMLRAAGDAAASAGRLISRIDRPPDGRVTLGRLLAVLANHPVGDAAIDDAIRSFTSPPRKILLVDDADLLPSDCIDVLRRLLQPEQAGSTVPAVVITCSAEPLPGDLAKFGGLASASVKMPRLGLAEVRDYIERSLWVAGGTTRRLIAADALRMIILRSNGLPGTVNRVMEAAFNAGFARGDPMITARTVTAAVGPRPKQRHPQPDSRVARVIPVIAAALFAVGVVAFLYEGLTHSRVAPAPDVRVAKPVPPTRQTAADAPMSADLMAALMKRGEQSLLLGDISAARLVFQHAAEAGNGVAATAVGKTYDPNFLPSGSAQAEKPDPARAAEWYRRAIVLGDPAAADLLRRLGQQN